LGNALTEAADEIERLRKENQKLRDALTYIQCKAHDTLRPIPFQEDDTTSAAISELEDDKGAKFNSVDDLMADLNAENEKLREYQELIWFIANDYYELSYDKIKWQRDDWRNRCRKLIEDEE
jgi:vacuolar-type H+-ATPase subunit I/STV1